MDQALVGYQRRHPGEPLTVGYLLRVAGSRDLAGIRAAVADRARRFPELTQRLVPPARMGRHPLWVPTPWFDADQHVREHLLPAGADLAAQVARLTQVAMPLDGPPWEMCVLRTTGRDDEFHLLLRASHAWLDGHALHRVLTLFFGDGADESAFPRPGHATARAVACAAGRLAGWAPASGTVDALRAPAAGRHDLHWATVGVENLRAIARAHRATVGDLLLVALAGALARWSPPVGAPVRALMPVAARRPQDREALGNQVVGARVTLPDGFDAPARRVAAVRRQTGRYQRGSDAGVGERWWFERLPAWLGPFSVAAGMDPRRVAVSTSNLGVLSGPLVVAGCPVTLAAPVPVPVAGQRLFVMLGGVAPVAVLGLAVEHGAPAGAALVGLWLAEIEAFARAARVVTVPSQSTATATAGAVAG